MNRAIIPVYMALSALSACNDDAVVKSTEIGEGTAVTVPIVGVNSTGDAFDTASSGSPVSIDYRIIGQPIVEQPVAINLSFRSSMGEQPINVSYRINDATALRMPESQPGSTTVSPTSGDENLSVAAHQVTVIPLREGRLYLNVAVQIETDTGSWANVTAVPIEVNTGSRELPENAQLSRSPLLKED